MLSSSTIWPLRMKRMLWRMGSSASAIGRIAVGREEERHVIVLLRRRYAETNGHHVQKRRIRQPVRRLEIGAGMEAELVDAGSESFALEDRPVEAPVTVGLGRSQPLLIEAIQAIELNRQPRRRSTERRVEDMSGEPAHRGNHP